MALIKDLAAILKKGDTVTLTLAIEDAGLRFCIFPKLFTMDGEKGEHRKALNQPLTGTGTVEELDSPEFVETIQKYTASILGLQTTLDEAETTHKAAADKGKSSSSSSSSSKGKAAVKPVVKKATLPVRPAAPVKKTALPNRPAIGKGKPADRSAGGPPASSSTEGAPSTATATAAEILAEQQAEQNAIAEEAPPVKAESAGDLAPEVNHAQPETTEEQPAAAEQQVQEEPATNNEQPAEAEAAPEPAKAATALEAAPDLL